MYLGAFDTINSQKFPSVHPQWAVVVRIRFQRIEKGKHKFKLDFVDEDGTPFVPSLNGEVTLNIEEPDRSATINIIANMNNLKFSHAGEYAVVLSIDNREMAKLPLHLKHVK